MKTNDPPNKLRKRSFYKQSLKKNFKPKPKSPNAPKTRKELRKEERKKKKADKHLFLLKRVGKTPELPPKKKRRQKKKSKRKNLDKKQQVKQEAGSHSDDSGSDDMDSAPKSFKEEELKLQKEMEVVRRKRLVEDNEMEEKTIKSLHKKLKLSKKAAIPASFRVDGLDYLLDFCNDFESKKLTESSPKADKKKSNKAFLDSDETDEEQDLDLQTDSEEEGSGSESDEENYDSKSDRSEAEADDDDHEYSDVEQDEDDIDTSSIEDEDKESQSQKDDDSGQWEDIYGRTRDKHGNIINDKEVTKSSASHSSTSDTPGKYIPPMRRQNDTSRDKIKKSLKGLLNRLSESNMHSIATQIEDLYMRNSRNEMNESLVELLEAVLIAPVISSDRIILEHMMLIAILHANVGTEVGAFFVQYFFSKFHKLHQKVSSLEENGKELENMILIIAYLYHFKIVDCSLIYEILNFLGESFTGKDVELILNVLRTVGFRLRKDDPASLKSLILLLQQKAADVKSTSSSRVKFMLDILLAIRNNNMNKIPNYDPSFGEHLLKIMKTFIRQGTYVSELKISMQDLLNADTKGKWWIVGSAWTNSDSNQDKTNLVGNVEGDSTIVQANEKLLAKAKRLGMNTDTRRNIFFILMTAEDYLDAFDKLVHLGLKNQLEREIIHVIVYCCLHEKKYNLYYALLASKFCSLDRRFVLTTQYNLWDRLKEFDAQESHHIQNLTQLLIHLINDRSLPITVLKIIDFADMKTTKLNFLKEVLAGILLAKNTDNLEEIFIKPALSEKLHLFCDSIKLFMNHFMLNESKVVTPEGESAKVLFEDPKILQLLKERIRIAERSMSLGHSKVQL